MCTPYIFRSNSTSSITQHSLETSHTSIEGSTLLPLFCVPIFVRGILFNRQLLWLFLLHKPYFFNLLSIRRTTALEGFAPINPIRSISQLLFKRCVYDFLYRALLQSASVRAYSSATAIAVFYFGPRGSGRRRTSFPGPPSSSLTNSVELTNDPSCLCNLLRNGSSQCSAALHGRTSEVCALRNTL